MMKEDELRVSRSVVNDLSQRPSVERALQLIDSHLEALAEIKDLNRQVDELDAERCDFQCDHCQDGEPTSLAAQCFTPEDRS